MSKRMRALWLCRAIPVSAILLASNVQADDRVELLLTSAPGAPTPADVVNFYATPHTGTPPLAAFATYPPAGVQYLLPDRASGDFLTMLQNHPSSTRAMLERYLVVTYPSATSKKSALSSVQADPYVAYASFVPDGEFSSDASETSGPGVDGTINQYGRAALNIDAAWTRAGGYSLVADIDSGLYVSHPALRQFSASGTYVGGNFIPVDSIDIGGTGRTPPIADDPSADELRPMVADSSMCDPGGVPVTPIYATHGTHTAGLIGANASAGLGVMGTCKNCGIAMWKITYLTCDQTDVVPALNWAASDRALTLVGDVGAQVANMSFGRTESNYTYCQSHPMDATCLAIAHARYRDIEIVAASGNDRTTLDFPAADGRITSVGGIDSTYALWDESPGGTQNCPFAPDTIECGSNYTTPANSPQQELVASAKDVWSTTYPFYNWNVTVHCGDQFPGPGWGNGVGLCTGTSMSAPQVAGVFGLIRSVNPLVPVGAPGSSNSLRGVVATTTAEAQAGQEWIATLGYGRPDAEAAVLKMLGKVATFTVKNRVTPLFRLYSAATHDYADTDSPQSAVALIINQANAWLPPTTLPTVPHYSSFPHDPADGTIAAPRASVYVLTTEYKPRSSTPDLAPLYLMDKTFAGGHRDFMLATTTADIQSAHTDGYSLRNIQGYIYKPCTPEPSCIPPFAQKFWRKCNNTFHDCATFLESERTNFENAGYTSAYPVGTNMMLGYAYPATDTDGDGLPDGFEWVIGTQYSNVDSDGDGVNDNVEYPMVGVPVSDPALSITGIGT